MMKKLLQVTLFVLILFGHTLVQSQNRPFITSWVAETDQDTIAIGLNGNLDYSFNYVWKDDNNVSLDSGLHTSVDGVFISSFAVAGNYTLEISSDFPHLTNYPKRQLLDVLQWGDIVWESFDNSFSGWTGSTFSATDAPILSSNGVSFFRIFRGARSYNADISHWDVSHVNKLNESFQNAESFDSDLSTWDLSQIGNYSRMFSGASNFRGIGVSQWNVKNATDFNATFSNTAITTAVYDSILINWSTQNVRNGLRLGINAGFCDGAAARDSLIINNNWDIRDAGAECLGTDILTFNVNGQLGNAIIDHVNHTVNLNIVTGTDLTALAPNFTLSTLAISDPVSGSVQDFSAPFIYQVIATDGTTQDWTVTVATRAFEAFITSWTITSGQEISIGLTEDLTYDFEYIWKNAANEVIRSGSHTSTNGNFETTFTVSDTYTLEITGAFPHFANYPKDNLLDVLQWGDISWESFNSTFSNWSGTSFSATDLPDLGQVTDMSSMFEEANSFNGNLSSWNVTNISNMSRMFLQANSFNSDISGWTTTNVTDMSFMFAAANSFNADLSNWDVRNLTNMNRMFNLTSSFNADLSDWDVRKVTNMFRMFRSSSFDQDISNWDILRVTNMGEMFNNSALSTINYDKILVGWSQQDVQNDVTLGASNINFCTGAAARQSLINNHNWIFSDDGELCSSENDIITFKIPDFQIGDETIDTINHTVNVNVVFTANLSALTPKITLSAEASISPDSDESRSFSNPVTYEVMASDGTLQEWTVIVTKSDTALNETDILSFRLSPESLGQGLINSINIDTSAHEILLFVLPDENLTVIIPDITLSPGASIATTSRTEIDVSSGGATYLVTAEDELTQQEWTLIVIGLQRPENDLCTTATVVNVGDTFISSSNFATSDQATTPICGSNRSIGRGVWYRLTGNGDAITINTCGEGTSFDTSLSVYTGSCTTGLACLAGNDDDCGFRSIVEFNSVNEQEYFILVDGFSATRTGQLELSISGSPALPTPPNDNCEDAELITVFAEGTGTPSNGNTTNAAVFTRSNCDSFGAINDVWFHFNSGPNTAVAVDLELADTDGVDSLNAANSINIALYTSCDGNSIECDRSGNDRTLNVTPNTDYLLQLWNNDLDEEGTFTIQVNDGPNTAASLALQNTVGTTLSISRFTTDDNQVDVITTDDTEGHAQLQSIISGNEEGIFAIDSISGVLTIVNQSALSTSATTSFDLTIQAADQGPGELTAEIIVTINIIDNTAPEVTSQTVAIDENSLNGTVVTALETTDADGDDLTLEIINGNIGEAFGIDEFGNIIVVEETQLNFENTPTFTLEIKATDDGPLNLSGTGLITINLNDVNDTPELADTEYSISQFSTNGFSIDIIAFNDQDIGQNHTYALSGEGADIFSINEATGLLTITNASLLLGNGEGTYELQVEVTDNGTPTLSGTGTMTINVFGNNPPIIISNTFNINENTSNGSLIATVEATDEENDEIVFTLANVTDVFSVNANGEIIVIDKSALDFESNPSFELLIAATDDGPGELQTLKTVSIQLNDLNEPPVASSGTVNIASVVANGTVIGQVEAEDPDDSNQLSYAIASGNESDIFAINETTGALSISNGSLLDPGIEPQHVIIVSVSDGEFNISTEITIDVFLNIAAPVLSTTSFPIDENNAVGQLIDTLVSDDEDGIESYTIVSGNEDGLFELNASSGELTAASTVAFNFEEVQQYILEVKVIDNGLGNLETIETVTIDINDVNEFAPFIVEVAAIGLDENTENGTSVVTITATDEDILQSLSYRIVGGNTDNAFAINNNGRLTVNDSMALNFEQTSAFSLAIEVSDNGNPIRTSSQLVDITINNQNEAPILELIGNLAVNVESELIFTVVATDEDEDVINYSIDAASIDQGMSINASTGAFSWTPTSDQGGQYDVLITVSDGLLETTERLVISVIDRTDILAFDLVEQTGPAVIDLNNHTIAIEVATGTDVTSLTPVVVLLEGAISSPASGQAVNFSNPVTYAVTAENGVTIQNWTVTVAIAPDTATDILTFLLDEQTGEVEINAEDHSIAIEVVFGTNVSSLTPILTLSEGATSSPNSGETVDFTNPATYTVTAEDGIAVQDWTVTVAIAAPSTETDMLSFILSEQTNDATINTADHTVTIEVPFGTDITSLKPTLTLSEGAISSPESGEVVDFTNEVTYTVTAQDAITTQDWVVTVIIAPNTATDILTFILDEQTSEAVINTEDHTVNLEVVSSADVSSLTPSLSFSEGANSSPESGESVDFTNPVIYIVTAEDETTTQDWTITVSVENQMNNEADLLTFVSAEQTGQAIIDTVNHTVVLEVTVGSDVSDLTPTVTLSEGASSSPASGETVDFTNPVTYIVTAEDGTTIQEWIVTVTEENGTLGTDTDILSFVLGEQTDNAIINTSNHTIEITVAFGTDVAALVPTLTLSERATSNPTNSETIDFTNPVTYTVTAEDGTTTQQWLVTVTEEVATSIGLESILDIYPNPVTDVLLVRAKEPIEAFIADLNGRRLIPEQKGIEIKFITTGLQSGIYLLIIMEGQKLRYRKIIKN